MAVGNAAAGRMSRAFEDAGKGHGTERGGNKNGGAREGKLADVRQRCCKRQHMSQRCGQEVEAVQQDATQQLAGANEEGGSRMDARGGCATKGNARRRWCNKRQCNDQNGKK